jgi:hypothetical protein
MLACMRTTLNLPDGLVAEAALPAYGEPGGRVLVDLSDRDAVWAVLDGDRPA